MHPLPQTGVLTFLFTDIEGSTTRWERSPDTMADALTTHDRLVGETLALHGGRVFKRAGDAFCCVFASPLSAATAAVQIQRTLASQAWDRAIGELRVRIGLHTGDAIASDDDYFGPTLNRVARIMASGHGGQILLSAATAELVRDGLPRDYQCRNLGTKRLRDLALPETIFQLSAPGLQAEFPELRTLDARPNNLPVELSSFVGRENDIGRLRDFIAQKRLVTLCGPGGIGKTRLALQAAAEMLDEFEDGVWFVPLSHTSDPALIGHAIAAALGVKEAAGEPIETTILRDLGARHALIVLDNAEQLVPAIGQIVKRILDRAPGLRMLVTSRESLHVRGEQVYRLGPVAEAASAQLFIERAQAVAHDFNPNDNPEDVAAIARELEGIPLAIELSAARLTTLSLHAIRERLRSQLTLLRSARSEESRHNTLRGTIAWSYDLLTSRERDLLSCLCFFSGGFTLEQCEQIAEAADLRDVLDDLEALIDKSFVTRSDWAGKPRYRMLEVIREYARERCALELAERAEARHCKLFSAFAARGEGALAHDELPAWLTAIDADLANVRAALEFGFRHDAPELADALLGMFRYWYIRHTIEEARSWLERFIVSRPDDPRLAGMLRRASALAGIAGKYDEADRLAKRALTLYHTHDDPAGVLESLHALAVNENRRGNYAAAETLYCDIAARCNAPGQERAAVTSRANCAAIKLQRGDLDAAEELLSACASSAEALGDGDVAATVTAMQGTLALKRGDYERASELYQTALRAKRELKNAFGAAEILDALAVASFKQRREAQALEQAAEALELGLSLETPYLAVIALETIALILAQTDSETAKAAFGLAQAMRRIHSVSAIGSLSRDAAATELRARYGSAIDAAPDRTSNWKAAATALLQRVREGGALVST